MISASIDCKNSDYSQPQNVEFHSFFEPFWPQSIFWLKLPHILELKRPGWRDMSEKNKSLLIALHFWFITIFKDRSMSYKSSCH